MVSEKFTKFVRISFIFLTVGITAFTLLFQPHSAQAQGVLCVASAGSLTGPYITVNLDQDHVNVRAGPNSYLYNKVGILYPGESAPAIGRTPGGDWIQIACPGALGGSGWVYSANVTLTSSGFLTVVDAPPTPTFTLNLDPTLAASLQVESTTTRLPTYTPPPPLATLPPYTDLPRLSASSWTGPIIAGLGLVGLIALFVSFLFRR